MIKVYRLFWSYDVNKTEAWLISMAEKGYQLVHLNRLKRCFFFKKDAPKKIVYRIVFDKVKNNILSKSLVEAGWNKTIQTKNWQILSNENPQEQIKIVPTRDSIIRHNQLIMYFFSGLLIYFGFTTLMDLAVIGIASTGDGYFVPSPWWVLTYTLLGLVIMLIIIGVYSVIKINKTNSWLRLENPYTAEGSNDPTVKLSKQKEKELKRSGQIIVKRKYGWMYAPDRLENWLEQMEELGFNLYRTNKLGTTFYFMKGNPRKISYCADYQNISNPDYFDTHIEAGWKHVYTSYGSFQKWTIWSREYIDGEEKPKIYSDKANHLKHARKIAITYSITFLPMLLLFILNLSVIYKNSMLDANSSKLTIMLPFLILFNLLMFGSFVIRLWMYYMRLKQYYKFK